MSYFSPLVAALITILVIAVILSSRFRDNIQDIPNERSLHSTPIPRIGGIGLMTGVLSAWALMFTSLAWWLMLPLIGLIFVSLLDDMHNLPVRQRFSAQIMAAAILVGGSGLFADHGIGIALVVLLFTVWMTNLYNFMDGSNGLAGGMALFGFIAYGIAALIAQNDALAMLNFSISAAAAGFLLYNFQPARVFMGDAGSIPLGFLTAAMGLLGWQQGAWAIWFPLMVFSPFIVDASVTLAKRTVRGVKVTEAHREHYYQRAIQMGWSHRKLALVEYALMLGSGISAILARDQALPWQAFLMWGCIYGALMIALDAAWRRTEREKHA
ncbi:MAG: glycosyltransferase family 4 protein [Sideroxyarcus sp.]|nr:glycosyltransferase family 4 protein [Sideroxyarcus sp.]